jgi:hypothetical protein
VYPFSIVLPKTSSLHRCICRFGGGSFWGGVTNCESGKEFWYATGALPALKTYDFSTDRFVRASEKVAE